ncbi:hypothetical protein CEXT_604201 [Caerostris extrusa]|uniref:Uncharacterized protein n=1 Tax=Caerostris extrusa TaxID=172846 RepID=A0AAV4TWQ3_CAEEX|nr:hypothetical protein CEXT_604201 [Caerostris extrusa]
MISIYDIGVVGMLVQTDSGPVPVEILATLCNPTTILLTVNVTDQTYGWDKCLTSWWMCNRAKLPFQGKYTLEEARVEIHRRYALKEQGIGLWVAVKRDIHKIFEFVDCPLLK